MSKRKPKADMPTTPVVDAISQLNFEGNIVPHQWYKTVIITTPTNRTKPDLLAILVLSDVCYWYRHRIVRDEDTGNIVSVERRFKADKLQKSYAAYAEFLGVSARQIKEAIDRLKIHGLVTTELRNIKTEAGLSLTNILYIEPVPDVIAKYSTIPANDLRTTILQNSVPGGTNLRTTSYENSGDITETTTQTTPEILQNTTCSGGGVPLCVASAKPKAPPIDPTVVITKIREAKDGAALTLESKECWTACLAIWESLYSRKMNEADKKMFGGIIKDTSLEMVGRAFVNILDGDIIPPDWPYIIACVTNTRNRDAYRQVKKDNPVILSYYDALAYCEKIGVSPLDGRAVERIDDEEGHPILGADRKTQFRKLPLDTRRWG